MLARVRLGDPEAYGELVRRHARVAVRTAAVLGAGADAEDVVQEAFVKAYGALDRFRPDAPFRPWLLRIVANEVHNLHRSAGRRGARERSAWALSEPLLAGSDAEDPSSAALDAERRAELVAGLARLSEPHRQVVACRYLLDLDETETATVLHWPRGTVKSRLHRALRQLSAQLSEAMPAQPSEAMPAQSSEAMPAQPSEAMPAQPSGPGTPVAPHPLGASSGSGSGSASDRRGGQDREVPGEV